MIIFLPFSFSEYSGCANELPRLGGFWVPTTYVLFEKKEKKTKKAFLCGGYTDTNYCQIVHTILVPYCKKFANTDFATKMS